MLFKIIAALLFRLPFYALAGLAFREAGFDLTLVYAALFANMFGTYLQGEVTSELARTRATTTENNPE